jgi:hypothetical protein
MLPGPMSRTSLLFTGLLGLAGGLVLTAFCLFVMLSGWIPPLVRDPFYVWLLFLFLLFFSVAEIPVMIVAMRRMAASPNPKAKYVVMVANAGYTLFAGVYAAPFILLAGHAMPELAAGALMSALGLVRFITAILFIPGANKNHV